MREASHDWALITGASSGIGRALAVALAQRDIAVLLSGRSKDRLAQVADQCRQSVPAVACAADLATTDGCKQLSDQAIAVVSAPDRLRFLVHCAGAGDPSPGFAAMQPPALAAAFAINVTAALALTQQVLPLLHAAPDSRVLLVGAGIADHAQPGTGIYGISKQALARLFQQMVVDFEHQADADLPALAMMQPGLVDSEGLRDHLAKAKRCHLPHALWLQRRLHEGDALSTRQAAAAMMHGLLELAPGAYHGQVLHGRQLLAEDKAKQAK